MAIYACSDLHGRLSAWNCIKDYLYKDDVLYIIGDVIDRGEDSYKILEDIIQKPKQYILLQGNHEFMAAAAIKHCMDENLMYSEVRLWYHNGGEITFNQLKENHKELFYQEYFTNLPYSIELNVNNKHNKHIVLCHSGKHYCYSNFCTIEDLVWNRSFIEVPWDNTRKDLENTYIIHGHTPVGFLKSTYLQAIDPIRPIEKDKFAIYANGHKINIDLGLSDPRNHIVGLLNLETFEEIYFKDNEGV